MTSVALDGRCYATQYEAWIANILSVLGFGYAYDEPIQSGLDYRFTFKVTGNGLPEPVFIEVYTTTQDEKILRERLAKYDLYVSLDHAVCLFDCGDEYGAYEAEFFLEYVLRHLRVSGLPIDRQAIEKRRGDILRGNSNTVAA